MNFYFALINNMVLGILALRLATFLYFVSTCGIIGLKYVNIFKALENIIPSVHLKRFIDIELD